MRRNQYEEALFRIEDDRYDLELLIERNNSVLRVCFDLAHHLSERITIWFVAAWTLYVRYGGSMSGCLKRRLTCF
jgi:histone deacetylase complex regulatory component SIN3